MRPRFCLLLSVCVLFVCEGGARADGQPIPLADPLPLAQALIAKSSVTPVDDGAMEVLAEAARASGFVVDIFEACEANRCIKNLMAQIGHGPPTLAFVGHTDVVPPGDLAAWSYPPFSATVADHKLWGRGAVDMKGAIAAFVTAVGRVPASEQTGSVHLWITGDEEQGSAQGMRAILQRALAKKALPDVGLIGEASSEGYLGQGIRVGRRGSINVSVTSRGVQGHVAWPAQAKNAVHPLLAFLSKAVEKDWGAAQGIFPPTSIQVTNITVPNEASNVVPGEASARLNVRFNRQYSGKELQHYFRQLATQTSSRLTLESRISGEPYLSKAVTLEKALRQAIHHVTGKTPSSNAGGGVSDGRFLHTHLPVIEFGLPGDTAHQIDEHVDVTDLYRLTDIYAEVIKGWGKT